MQKTVFKISKMDCPSEENLIKMKLSDIEGIKKLSGIAHITLQMPKSNEFILPILYSIPVQMLAYYTAVAKGTDVDQPRNLAKSVTVE